MSEKAEKGWIRGVFMLAVPFAVTLAGLWVWLSGGRFVSTENAYVKAHIAQVSAEVGGRIANVAVRDHTRVETGSVVLEIDPVPFQLALLRAQAEVDRSRQQVSALIASWREAQSEMAEAEKQAEYWARQMERQQQLASRGIVASSKLEEVTRDTAQANERVTTMRRRLERVSAELGQHVDAAIDAHPVVRERLAIRDQAALDLAKTSVRAPISGIAVNVRAQPGEHIRAAHPLFAIVDDQEPWLEANFKETELTHVDTGQAVTVSLDVYPGRSWSGEIVSISPATGAEFALLPPQNASGNWVKVVQRLPVRIRVFREPGDPPLRAGMTASVRVDTRQARRIDSLLRIWKPAQDGSGAVGWQQPNSNAEGQFALK